MADEYDRREVGGYLQVILRVAIFMQIEEES
jgi:hypothetical protein